tara:strand:- start:33396 stop:34454 length:1059 start_codon:yes stop_codon:yes gene_type:complete
MFDPHWHARDFQSQRHKETIAHSLEVAYACGLDAIAAMPNTNPPLTTHALVKEYLSIADQAKSPVEFFVHGGLTSDPEQIKGIVEAWQTEKNLIGLKAYWGRSTGDLSIVELHEQYKTIQTLAREGYDGVLVSHCEKESLMNDKAYDKLNPRTWSTHARPEEAEVESFKDILRIARDVKFQGTIHVAHVSTTRVVDLIHSYSRINPDIKLSCGITPHHLLMNYRMLDGPHGRWYKCNPPLRSPETVSGMQERLLENKITNIESDHAPHTEEDKSQEIPASGLGNATFWGWQKYHLRELGCSPKQVEDLTSNNAKTLYEKKTEHLFFTNREPDFKKIKELQGFYHYDPMQHLK